MSWVRSPLAAPNIITIFVRHGFNDDKPCKYSGDEFSRRSNCPKHLRWTQNGKQYRRKAGTRSWETAEEVKRQLRDQLAGRASDIVATDNVHGRPLVNRWPHADFSVQICLDA